MDFNKETVSKIAANAKAAQETWGDFAHNKKMCECFHLRPTASGIRLYNWKTEQRKPGSVCGFTKDRLL